VRADARADRGSGAGEDGAVEARPRTEPLPPGPASAAHRQAMHRRQPGVATVAVVPLAFEQTMLADEFRVA